jgi:hypothetical protein
MKKDGVHQDFFPMPELPYKRKEREAIKLLQEILKDYYDDKHATTFLNDVSFLLWKYKDLVDWIMKYKGE